MNPSRPLSATELLARNLRRQRLERGLTSDDLAKASGIAVTRLKAIEATTAQARLDDLSRLARALGVPIAALFDAG